MHDNILVMQIAHGPCDVDVIRSQKGAIMKHLIDLLPAAQTRYNMPRYGYVQEPWGPIHTSNGIIKAAGQSVPPF